MGRFLAGVASALLLVTAGLFWWRSSSAADIAPIPAPGPGLTMPMAAAPIAEPPAASEKTREEKRFARYDRDKNGAVAREEYLLSRRKAFAKLDTNGDGRLSPDEYAIKTVEKFAKADADRSGALAPAEFATTRVVRKAARKTSAPVCPPPRAAADDEDS
ncbi:MAG: signal transduction protein [Sphingomonas bacterium]|nr:signal transduction protein [Sphingomonas bacterium]MDB5683702.1 signal transduction protein [Sphingomonas bacterium]